jgi:hypothetical protein
MESDMIVALKEASANGTTLFGLNHYADLNLRHGVHMAPGQMHDPGETAQTCILEVAQARQTYAVLGLQPVGEWGFTHGVNEHRVAIGVTDWKSRLPDGPATLDGPDLVRLALERGRGALQAVEVLTDLLQRHGQHHADGSKGASDHIFLIADAQEAFVLETSGRYWALIECGRTRVVADVAMIRQDWHRLAPGLADFVIEQGWGHDDGSKIDFVRSLGVTSEQSNNAQKRWGRASLALAQQHGAIDLHYLRHMLSEHYFENRDILPGQKTMTLASSFLVDLHRNEEPMLAWIAFGPPEVALYFPLCLAGELPTAFADGVSTSPSIPQRTLELLRFAQSKDRTKLPSALERLQTKFDQDAEDFLAKASELLHQGKPYLVRQLATEMMHNHVELFEKEYRRLFGIEQHAPHRIHAYEEEVLFFA